LLFNSLEFLFFFPIVTCLFFLIPHRFRWALLFVSSSIFYGFFIPEYLLILYAIILVDYYAGIKIYHSVGLAKRRWLQVSLAANIFILFVFKYFNFFANNLNWLSGSRDYIPLFNLILPIGLSFHTFQAMSYTIEIYWGRQKPELHLGYYAVYVLYFPQLVAGPIERPQNLIHQFHQKHTLNFERTLSGFNLILMGFFKKIFVADKLALAADPIFRSLSTATGPELFLAINMFAFQIYADFSGYSDIARGCSRILGIELMENFRRPYLATDPREFWRRWHISLTTWFRDYLYIPLGGKAAKLKNTLFVFSISGLWHGASWNYVIWGFLNGLFVSRTPEGKSRSYPLISWFITYTLILISWVFFRLPSAGDAKTFFSRVVNQWHLVDFASRLSFYWQELFVILLLLGVDFAIERQWVHKGMRTLPIALRPVLYATIIMFLWVFGTFSANQFIYFQF
jgi:alginate O-acetyltransferase complex protein AlgI